MIGQCFLHWVVHICSSHCNVRKCLTHYDIKTMLIMVNHVGPCLLWLAMVYFRIAMLIMFSSLDHDIMFYLSHGIVRLWSSHCNVGFLFITLWHWNRFVTFREWFIFVTLRRREMVVSLKCFSMFFKLPHWFVYITW
jgi:hypothetical protein